MDNEEDIFICGRCKTQFTSLQLFVSHKKYCSNSVDEAQIVEDGNHVLPEDETFKSETQLLGVKKNGFVVSLDESITLQDILPFTRTEHNFYTSTIIVPSNSFLTDQNPNESNSEDVKDIQLAITQLPKRKPLAKKLKITHNKACEPGFACSYCDHTFKTNFELVQHLRKHTGEKPFSCVVCGRSFAQKINVKRHLQYRHRVWPSEVRSVSNVDDVLNDKPYGCQYCLATFDKYALFKKHLATHADKKVYKCLQAGCHATFIEIADFLSHNDSQHRDSGSFTCHMCQQCFASQHALIDHQNSYHSKLCSESDAETKGSIKRRLKCKVCNDMFSTRDSLLLHETTTSHHYECPECKLVFVRERCLRRHLTTHSSKKFSCDKCSKTFRSKLYLRNHQLIHSGEKPFQCCYCEKSFFAKFRLQRHTAIHLGVKYECSFKKKLGCEQVFPRKDRLKKHLATHTAKTCECGVSFASYTKLQQHKKEEHSKISSRQCFRCEQCSQTFRKEDLFAQHHCTVDTKHKFVPRKEKNTEEFSSADKVANIEIIVIPEQNYISNNNDLIFLS